MPRHFGFGKSVNDYYNQYVLATDAKAGAVMAAAGVIGAALLSEKWVVPSTTTGSALRIVALALLAATLAMGAWVIFPRLPSSRRGVIFWEDVKAFKDYSE